MFRKKYARIPFIPAAGALFHGWFFSPEIRLGSGSASGEGLAPWLGAVAPLLVDSEIQLALSSGEGWRGWDAFCVFMDGCL